MSILVTFLGHCIGVLLVFYILVIVPPEMDAKSSIFVFVLAGMLSISKC